MATDALDARSTEREPQGDSLFPIAPGLIHEELTTLKLSSNDMLRMITTAMGRFGPADELYTNMPFDELVAWHTTAHDFGPDGELLYKTGLLYGMNIAAEVASQKDVASRLRFGSVEAFERALEYLEHSYRGLTDEQDVNWKRQKERELLHTGSDVFTLTNSTLSDRIAFRLKLLGASVENNALAEHTGLVDGAIFVDAYRAYVRGEAPARFDRPVIEYAPTYDFRRHLAAPLDLVLPVLFDDLKIAMIGLETFHKTQVKIKSDEPVTDTLLHGHRRYVQLGPDHFSTAVEVTAVEASVDALRVSGSRLVFEKLLQEAKELDVPLYLPPDPYPGLRPEKDDL